MKIMGSVITVLAILTSSAFASDNVTVKAGDKEFTAVPSCGYKARVKAVYSNVSGDQGRLVLRVCDNDWCGFPVLLNTNAKFEVSGDGKTELYYSTQEGKKLNATCTEFQMHNPTGTQRLRSKIGSGGNAAKITIE